jgi:hypothetical protein
MLITEKLQHISIHVLHKNRSDIATTYGDDFVSLLINDTFLNMLAT